MKDEGEFAGGRTVVGGILGEAAGAKARKERRMHCVEASTSRSMLFYVGWAAGCSGEEAREMPGGRS